MCPCSGPRLARSPSRTGARRPSRQRRRIVPAQGGGELAYALRLLLGEEGVGRLCAHHLQRKRKRVSRPEQVRRRNARQAVAGRSAALLATCVLAAVALGIGLWQEAKNPRFAVEIVAIKGLAHTRSDQILTAANLPPGRKRLAHRPWRLDAPPRVAAVDRPGVRPCRLAEPSDHRRDRAPACSPASRSPLRAAKKNRCCATPSSTTPSGFSRSAPTPKPRPIYRCWS